MTGANFSSWYRQGEGTLFAAFNTTSQGGLGVVGISGAAPVNNRIGLYQNGNSANYQAQVISNGFTEIQQIVPATVSGNNKLALGFSTNNSVVLGNGSISVTDTSCIIPTTDITSLFIGQAAFAGYLNGTLARITYYPQRLSNAELVEITA
jgi:hypothetical protein